MEILKLFQFHPQYTNILCLLSRLRQILVYSLLQLSGGNEHDKNLHSKLMHSHYSHLHKRDYLLSSLYR